MAIAYEHTQVKLMLVRFLIIYLDHVLQNEKPDWRICWRYREDLKQYLKSRSRTKVLAARTISLLKGVPGRSNNKHREDCPSSPIQRMVLTIFRDETTALKSQKHEFCLLLKNRREQCPSSRKFICVGFLPDQRAWAGSCWDCKGVLGPLPSLWFYR